MKPGVANVLRLLVDEVALKEIPRGRLDVQARAESIVESLESGYAILERTPSGAALRVTEAGVHALAEHLMGRPS